MHEQLDGAGAGAARGAEVRGDALVGGGVLGGGHAGGERCAVRPGRLAGVGGRCGGCGRGDGGQGQQKRGRGGCCQARGRRAIWFLVRDIGLAVRPRHLRVGYEPAALSIDVTCTQSERRGGNLARLRLEAVFRRDGDVVATGGGSFSCLAPQVYRRVRGARVLARDCRRLAPISAAAPRSVGRVSPMDVVLSPTGEHNR
ncbi:hypothetical protein SGLAM104S_03505 [Streptomyces glaucescens]